jgi:hypothetical protein
MPGVPGDSFAPLGEGVAPKLLGTRPYGVWGHVALSVATTVVRNVPDDPAGAPPNI